jgi:hypothetical protein
MRMQKVTSSNIESVGHDAETLRIKFTTGAEYDYQGVSEETFRGMLGAESVGRYFAANIRGKYQHKQVEE